jgi:hypothetical protein
MKNLKLVPAIALLVSLWLPFAINITGLSGFFPSQTYTFLAAMDWGFGTWAAILLIRNK